MSRNSLDIKKLKKTPKQTLNEKQGSVQSSIVRLNPVI